MSDDRPVPLDVWIRSRLGLSPDEGYAITGPVFVAETRAERILRRAEELLERRREEQRWADRKRAADERRQKAQKSHHSLFPGSWMPSAHVPLELLAAIDDDGIVHVEDLHFRVGPD